MRRYEGREARFSNRTLLNYAAANLPETLAVIRAQDEKPAEILLYDEIGFFGVSAKDFALALAKVGDGPVNVRINSPGGDVFDGLAIYNALKARAAPVNCFVDGLAASAASFIALAGSRLVMAEASMLMIHKAWGLAIGNEEDMTQTAQVLRKIDGQLADIYAGKTRQSPVQMLAMMAAETWLTAEEARTGGFCDLVEGAPPARMARASMLARSGVAALMEKIRAGLPPYDPDGDGDNDAEEALGLVNSAVVLLQQAAESLCGDDDDDGDGDDGDGSDRAMPLVPGARAAASEPEWVVGAAEDLPIDLRDGWDGPAAAERLLDAAGFNGNSPDPAMAKRGFLVWDHHNPNLKGSYKLPFADRIGGELKAVRGGIDAAASRLPQTDIPAALKARARDVLDAYEARIKKTEGENAARLARQRRLRLALAELSA